jgi:hypothetical protein
MNTPPIRTLSPAGEGFVKTATAAPDFELTQLEGIPDNYNGPSVVKKDFTFETIDCPAGESTYIVVMPTSAVAYYRPPTPTGFGLPLPDGTIFAPHYFPDSGDIFDGVDSEIEVSNSSQLSRGRLMALSAELNCVTNSFNQYGTISCWKTPISRTLAPEGNLTPVPNNMENMIYTGCGALTKVALDSQAYVAPVRNGVYSVSMNREENFDFYPVSDKINKMSTIGAWFSKTEKLWFHGCAPVYDNGFDTIVFRIDVPADTTNQSFVLKIWKVWEFQPTFNSLLYDFSHLSPDVDPASLQLYREMCRNLPVAVRDRDNPDFWNTILAAVDSASGLLSLVPGPIGMAATGVHAVSSMITATHKRKSKNASRSQPKPRAKPLPRAQKAKGKAARRKTGRR